MSSSPIRPSRGEQFEMWAGALDTFASCIGLSAGVQSLVHVAVQTRTGPDQKPPVARPLPKRPAEIVPLDSDSVLPEKGPYWGPTRGYQGQRRTDHVRLLNVDDRSKRSCDVFYGEALTGRIFSVEIRMASETSNVITAYPTN